MGAKRDYQSLRVGRVIVGFCWAVLLVVAVWRSGGPVALLRGISRDFWHTVAQPAAASALALVVFGLLGGIAVLFGQLFGLLPRDDENDSTVRVFGAIGLGSIIAIWLVAVMAAMQLVITLFGVSITDRAAFYWSVALTMGLIAFARLHKGVSRAAGRAAQGTSDEVGRVSDEFVTRQAPSEEFVPPDWRSAVDEELERPDVKRVVSCPNCHRDLRVPLNRSVTARCPGCGQVFPT